MAVVTSPPDDTVAERYRTSGARPISAFIWNSSLFADGVVTLRQGRWMIRRIKRATGGKSASEAAGSTPSVLNTDDREPNAQYLQIATGQWCGEAAATKFNSRESARAYAVEYGLKLGRDAQLVRPVEQAAS